MPKLQHTGQNRHVPLCKRAQNEHSPDLLARDVVVEAVVGVTAWWCLVVVGQRVLWEVQFAPHLAGMNRFC